MKLYLISQDENTRYDTFDSAVVAAESIEDARQIHPLEGIFPEQAERPWPKGWCNSWAKEPSRVSVKLIGTADRRLSSGVICASFNAG